MIRDITIGQYYRAESVIHKLDPRVKILGTLMYMISLFTFQKMSGYIVAGTFFIFVLWQSKVPFLYTVRGLRPIFIMLVFTAFLNLFWTEGEVLLKIGGISVTKEGLWKMAYISLRLIFLILGASIMTLTTTPNDLTCGMERLLSPLKMFHVPVHEIAMMMSIALRFIPILIEETNRIMKAQTARGADFESGNVFVRLKNMLPLVLPLFVSAIRRANELAQAMDARCYHGGEGRTKMYPLYYKGIDLLSFLICILYLTALFITIRFFKFF